MTRWMLLVFEAIKRHPLVAPFAWKIVIVQGAFMLRDGGGAQDSSGVHNAAGCLDIRTWNLTTAEITAWVHASRLLGFPFWRRDWTWAHGGMSPHAHGTLLSDMPLSSGAATSRSSYINSGDGLAGVRGDYEWRPIPIVLFPPNELLMEDYLMTAAAEQKLDQVLKGVAQLGKDLDTFRTNQSKRDRDLLAEVRASKERVVGVVGKTIDQLGLITSQVSDDATKRDLNKLQQALMQALADDPNVTGLDNPAPEHLGQGPA